jgi:hypothetical protein
MSKRIKCGRCDGIGQVAAGVNYPDECPDCGGSGLITQYPSGALAKYEGGPFLAGPSSKKPLSRIPDIQIKGAA